MRPVTKVLLYIAGAGALLIALFGLGVYVREIFLSGFSDDKSLLFWYLPFLFAGLIALQVFFAIVRLLRRARSPGDE